MNHRCDEECVCPIHGTPLFYASVSDDHACQDVDCEYGRGGVPGLDDLPMRTHTV